MPQWHSDINQVTIKIDHGTCYGAGECVNTCPASVYAINEDGKAVAENVEDCIECASCDGVCPTESIWHSVWS
jgi:NAD-dependent dihydropyrimidine dehydrogenase PreA subunit